jgi:hemolysin activation/secretion protein
MRPLLSPAASYSLRLIALACSLSALCGSAYASTEPSLSLIRSFNVSGDNPLSDAQMSQVLAPFLRSQANMATVERVAAAVQAELDRAGFVQHKAILPAQDVQDTLELKIIKIAQNTAAPLSATAQPIPIAQAQTFAITGFQISGDNPLGEASAQLVLAPFISSQASIDSLQKATAALDARLQAQGFALHRATLPPQALAGKVRIDILKFKIGEVKVEGAANYSEANARAALPELQSGGSPSFPLLAKQTALANESPYRKLGVTLKASEQVDTIDATIRVKDSKPWMATVSLSNGGSKETGRDRFTVSANHANLWDRDHLADIAYTTSLDQPSSVRQLGLNYKIPVYPWAGSFNFSASTSTVKGEFGTFTTSGAGQNWAIGYQQHLGGSGGNRHFASLKFEDKLSKATAVSGIAIGADRRSRPLTLGYNLRSTSDDALMDFGASYAVNLVSGHGNDDATYQLEDPNRNPLAHWKAWRFQGNLVKPFAKNWQFVWRSQAQIANQPLIAAEQLAGGNTLWLRGANGVSADRGLLSAIDLTSPEIVKGLRALMTFDLGYFANNAATLAKPKSDQLSTLGLGLRYNGPSGMFVTADYGYVLKGSAIPLTLNSQSPQKGDDRFYLTIGARF